MKVSEERQIVVLAKSPTESQLSLALSVAATGTSIGDGISKVCQDTTVNQHTKVEA